MNFVTFHINGAKRTRRAQILTRATPYATLRIDRRDVLRMVVVRIERNHLYRPCRTMPCAVST